MVVLAAAEPQGAVCERIARSQQTHVTRPWSPSLRHRAVGGRDLRVCMLGVGDRCQGALLRNGGRWRCCVLPRQPPWGLGRAPHLPSESANTSQHTRRTHATCADFCWPGDRPSLTGAQLPFKAKGLSVRCVMFWGCVCHGRRGAVNPKQNAGAVVGFGSALCAAAARGRDVPANCAKQTDSAPLRIKVPGLAWPTSRRGKRAALYLTC